MLTSKEAFINWLLLLENYELFDYNQFYLFIYFFNYWLFKILKNILHENLTDSHHEWPVWCFQMYRVYGNDQEIETTRLTDTLSSFGDDNRVSSDFKQLNQ